jgi:DNA-binding SARP family transcriptional activator
VEQGTRSAKEAFALAQRHGYTGLLTVPTLFGPRDRMMLVPPLLAARSPEFPTDQQDRSWRGAAQLLLNRWFPEIAADENIHTYHPGVTLHIQTFGPFRVWRGSQEIGPHEWQRKKAQQMLALFLTNRDRWLLREQICDLLWPDEAPPDAEAQFKVTLNGLNTALEPLRPPRVPTYYVRRQGGAYRFCPPAGISLDVVEFEALLAAAGTLNAATLPADLTASSGNPEVATLYSALTSAVQRHQGEYLSDWLYEDWARNERERLESRYMDAATRLASVLVSRNESSEAIRLCESVLTRDPGWEDAYCVLMRAYAMQGQRRMALSTYERCVRNLRECLDMEPLPSTVRIYEEVKA